MRDLPQRLNTTAAAALLLAAATCAGAEQPFAPYSQPIPDTALDIAMVPVTGGSFTMGSPEDEPGRSAAEGPRHEVIVDDFWMGQYEINWQQYNVFVQRDANFNKLADPASLKALAIDGVTGATAPYMEMSMGMGKEGYPAINLTQYAALNYARWLSARTGQFYRLPTEAEWEYACRAGTDSAWSFGALATQADDYAVHKGNSGGKYATTGSRQPNPWQLYDMHGNVAEWTMDQFAADYYAGSPADNPWNRPTTLYPRVARGGSWTHDINQARCAARLPSDPLWKDFDPQIPRSLWWHTSAPFIGFRLVRPRVQPSAEEIRNYWLEALDDYGN